MGRRRRGWCWVGVGEARRHHISKLSRVDAGKRRYRCLYPIVANSSLGEREGEVLCLAIANAAVPESRFSMSSPLFVTVFVRNGCWIWAFVNPGSRSPVQCKHLSSLIACLRSVMASAEEDDGGARGGQKSTQNFTAVVPLDRAEESDIPFFYSSATLSTTMLQCRTYSCPACQLLFTPTWAISR